MSKAARPLPNNRMRTIESAAELLEEEGAEFGEVIFAGGVYYAHFFKSEEPDAHVSGLDKSRTTAVMQSYAAQSLLDSEPDEVLQSLFLHPFMENLPPGWSARRGELRVPEDDYSEIRTDYRDFLKQSEFFDLDDEELLFGRNTSYFGNPRNSSGHYRIELQGNRPGRSINPDILRETPDVAVPDGIETENMKDFSAEADVVWTNNVRDYFRMYGDSLEDFLEAANQLGDTEEGYYLETYTADGADSHERLMKTAEELEGYRYEAVPGDIDGALVRKILGGELNQEKSAIPLENQENFSLLRVESERTGS
ncbi:MAG: hypothetical protein ABEJ36_02705 [Candidatus Nanosalina sp.]